MTEPIKLPPLPEEDGYILCSIAGREVEINAYRPSTLEEYATAAIDADRRARDEPVGYVSSQAVLCNFPICLPADLFQTEEELLQEYPEAMPMPVYTAPQPKQQASESVANHDLNTSKGGREYLAEFFAKRLGRHDFQRYITDTLAADFACVLSKWLRDYAPQPQQIPEGYRAALQSQKPKANDLMLSAVLRMPFGMAMADPISRMQFYQRAQQALDELEALRSQDREDVTTLKAGLEEAAQTMRAVLAQERLKAVAKRCLSRAIGVCDRAIDHARRVEGEG